MGRSSISCRCSLAGSARKTRSGVRPGPEPARRPPWPGGSGHRSRSGRPRRHARMRLQPYERPGCPRPDRPKRSRTPGLEPGPGLPNRTMSIGSCPGSDARASSSRGSTWPASSWILATADTVTWGSRSSAAPDVIRSARPACSAARYAGPPRGATTRTVIAPGPEPKDASTAGAQVMARLLPNRPRTVAVSTTTTEGSVSGVAGPRTTSLLAGKPWFCSAAHIGASHDTVTSGLTCSATHAAACARTSGEERATWLVATAAIDPATMTPRPSAIRRIPARRRGFRGSTAAAAPSRIWLVPLPGTLVSSGPVPSLTADSGGGTRPGTVVVRPAAACRPPPPPACAAAIPLTAQPAQPAERRWPRPRPEYGEAVPCPGRCLPTVRPPCGYPRTGRRDPGETAVPLRRHRDRREGLWRLLDC